MEWYPFDIGAYQRDTFELKPLEHWAYRSLMDQYYLMGGALPNDQRILYRMIGALTKNERSSVKVVLSKHFFTNGDGKLHNTRCDEEIKKYQRICSTNRDTALAREAARRLHESATNRAPKEREIDRKKEEKPVDNSTCKHHNEDGSYCGKPGRHKLHPMSKDWFCNEHPEG